MIARLIEKEKRFKELKISELVPGQLIEFDYCWVGPADAATCVHIGLRTYSGLVSLSSPNKTWTIIESIVTGRVLPAGTTVELTSEV
jgi:hypothetical protein